MGGNYCLSYQNAKGGQKSWFSVALAVLGMTLWRDCDGFDDGLDSDGSDQISAIF